MEAIYEKKHFNNDIFFIIVNKKGDIIQWNMKERETNFSLLQFTYARENFYKKVVRKLYYKIIFSINYNKVQ